jgi:hypothetical protein
MSSVETMAKAAYTVGRFQPPTIGHRMLIQRTIQEAGEGKAFVFVSSTHGTKGEEARRNPLTSAQKLPLLKHMFKAEVAAGRLEFIDTAACDPKCGGPGAAFGYLMKAKSYEPADIVFVIGKERLDKEKNPKEYFGQGAPLWGKEGIQPAAFIPVGETAVRDMSAPASDEANMSGTKARSYIKGGKLDDFYTAIGVTPEDMGDKDLKAAIDSVITSIRGSQKGGAASARDATEPPPSIYGPDGEPPRVKRRTRRRKSGFMQKKRMTIHKTR